MKHTKEEIENARKRLEEVIFYGLPEGRRPTIYTICRKVSPSGATRWLSVKVVGQDRELVDVTYYVGVVLGLQIQDTGQRAVKVVGGGMDMGYHLAHSIIGTLCGHSKKFRHEWA
jgi:hypothetical protein